MFQTQFSDPVPRFTRPTSILNSAHYNDCAICRKQPTTTRHHSQTTMPSPSNTLLIEGSTEELADELAIYIDVLRAAQGVEGPIQPEVNTLLQEKKIEDALKKLVGAASILNSAPEKGVYSLLSSLGPKANLSQKSSQPTTSSYTSSKRHPSPRCSSREYVSTSQSQ